MDPDLMRHRVAAARVARLGTIDGRGRPHLVPICFAMDGETLYSPVDDVKAKSTRSLRRLENIRLQPAVTVLVDHYEEDWSALWWVRLDGRAQVVDAGSEQHEAAVGLLVTKYDQYAEDRLRGPIVAATIDRWRGWP